MLGELALKQVGQAQLVFASVSQTLQHALAPQWDDSLLTWSGVALASLGCRHRRHARIAPVHPALSDTPIRTVSRLLLLAGEAAVPSSRTRRSSWTVDVAQKAAAVVAATSVSRIAPSAVCVPRAVGAAGRLRGRRGGLSGRCEGHLVPVELQ